MPHSCLYEGFLCNPLFQYMFCRINSEYRRAAERPKRKPASPKGFRRRMEKSQNSYQQSNCSQKHGIINTAKSKLRLHTQLENWSRAPSHCLWTLLHYQSPTQLTFREEPSSWKPRPPECGSSSSPARAFLPLLGNQRNASSP